MEQRPVLSGVRQALETGMPLAKCQQCGCMRETLGSLTTQLPVIATAEAETLARQVARWSDQMQPLRYACLGCDVCYAGVAQNAFGEAYPALNAGALSCDFQPVANSWPAVAGEYYVLDPGAPIAVSTLGSVALAQELAAARPAGLAIAGKTETENIGIDKIVKNVISNSALRYLIVCGNEAAGHLSGSALLALAANGVDAGSRIIGSRAKRPVLRNVLTAEIEAFRAQVEVVDMIGCESVAEIAARIVELAGRIPVVEPAPAEAACSCSGCCDSPALAPSATFAPLIAQEPGRDVPLDKAGYFVIVPQPERGLINVEHYGYDNTLLHVIEGGTARAVYLAIIEKGWVAELTHAAYLGKELARAELSLALGFKYVQDGA